MSSSWSTVLLFLLVFGTGVGAGWSGRGVYDGSTITQSKAAERAQGSVDVAIEADRKITASTTATETAVERVRYVTRTVEVAAECPPGRGPVSADMDQQLRDLAQARQARADTAARPRRVPQ